MEYGLLLLLRFLKVGGIMSESKIIWHKYPDEKPPKDGLFLITHRFRNQIRVDMAYFTKDIKSETVTAWAELPEPYKEENNE